MAASTRRPISVPEAHAIEALFSSHHQVHEELTDQQVAAAVREVLHRHGLAWALAQLADAYGHQDAAWAHTRTEGPAQRADWARRHVLTAAEHGVDWGAVLADTEAMTS